MSSDNSRVEFISETRNRPEIVMSDANNRLPRLRFDRIGARPISPLLRRSVSPASDNRNNSHSLQPLIEPDERENEPPLAGPEIDDDLDELLPNNKPIDDDPKGIDDGFLVPDVATNGNEPEAEDVDPDLINTIFNIYPRSGGDEPDLPTNPTNPPGAEGGMNPPPTSPLPPLSPKPTNLPFPPGFDNGFGVATSSLPPGSVLGIDGTITLADGRRIPDVNVYQNKKTLAQGMMDLALFSANANQLRYVLESSQSHPYHLPGIILISISLILQVAVGIGLIWNSRYNVRDQKQICIANKVNNFTIMGIFVVTVLNVFISVFSVGVIETT